MIKAQQATKQDRSGQQALAVQQAAHTLGYVMERVGADVGAAIDIEVTVDHVATSSREGTSITIKCTSDNAHGAKHCKDLAADLTKQGCKCTKIKNGNSCVCTA